MQSLLHGTEELLHENEAYPNRKRDTQKSNILVFETRIDEPVPGPVPSSDRYATIPYRTVPVWIPVLLN